jgi:hypothetical protein
MVMMTAMTPSLKASSRFLPIFVLSKFLIEMKPVQAIHIH